MRKKYLHIFILSLVLFLSLSFNFVLAAPEAAKTPAEPGTFNCQEFKNRFQVTVNGTTYNTIGALTQFCSFADVTTFALNWALILVGTAAVIFIILGGYWLIFSAGNEEQAEKGRKVLTNSVIGLIVVIMAAAIVRVVVSALRTDPPNRSTSSTTSDTTTNSASNGSQNPSANNSNSSSGQQTSMFDVPNIGDQNLLTKYSQIIIDKNNKVSFGFYLSSISDTSALAQLKTICNGQSDPAMKGYINNIEVSQASFDKKVYLNPGKAMVNIPATKIVATNDVITLKICEKTVNQITVSNLQLTKPQNIRS